ncbi:hypothetical protein RUM43_012756 [Polyplax serrata]|uniref:Nucleolar protein 4 n=1 Tax=Polyplax serrata TaxID=468196 RepID=A0AAN8S9Q2_POLSC
METRVLTQGRISQTQRPSFLLLAPDTPLGFRHTSYADLTNLATIRSDVGSEYKKVAIVENFFDIIYGVHVEIDGRNGKHAGQKRTYRTITETYAFLPREAVTKFLLNCYECQRRPNSPAIRKILAVKAKNLKILPQLLEKTFNVVQEKPKRETDMSETTESSNCEQNSPENLCKRDSKGKDKRFGRLGTIPLVPRYEEDDEPGGLGSIADRDLVHTSTPMRKENNDPREKNLEMEKTALGPGDTSSDSELSNGRKPNAIFNFAGKNRTGRFDGSTGSDTSDSSYENVLSKRKNFRKLNDVERTRRGIFENNRINEISRKEAVVFPICYPLPKLDGKKKFVMADKEAFEEYFDEPEVKRHKGTTEICRGNKNRQICNQKSAIDVDKYLDRYMSSQEKMAPG